MVMKMRTSRHYKALISIFRAESERLRRAADEARKTDTVTYHAHMHLYLCNIYAEIADITLNEHEKDLFLEVVRECSSEMSALVGDFYMKLHENKKEVD